MNQRHQLNRVLQRPARLGCLISKPAERTAADRRGWPLLLFLHGSGERGSNLSRVAAHGPPRLIRAGQSLPFVVVSPQCPAGQTWDRTLLLALLDDVMSRHPIDPKRVYVTGMSMGGYGAWDLAVHHPERFAAVAPVCGGGGILELLLEDRRLTRAWRRLGIWAFHGDADDVVPVQETHRMADAFRRAGAERVKVTIYPGVQHDSWTATYANPELYTWLLEHRR